MRNKFLNWIQYTLFYSTTREYKEAMDFEKHQESRHEILYEAIREMYGGWNNILRQNQKNIENQRNIEYFGRTQEQSEATMNAFNKSHEKDLKNKNEVRK